MDKVAIYTLGCKANQADSDSIAAELSGIGFALVDSKDAADIYIINTCTVTGKAAYQSRQAVRRVARKRPGAKIVVTGCDAEVEKKVLEDIEGVSEVFGVAERDKLLQLLHEWKTRQSNVIDSFTPSLSKGEYVMTTRARPFVRIQDGCENFCSYCIVPFTRGPVRSSTEESIISTVRKLSDEGYYEIVLTGIHIGVYGRDAGSSLDVLLERLLGETAIPRIRLSSIEPDELTESLIRMIVRSGGRICPHLHVPLQSGCDATLQRMKRNYSAKDYAQCIDKIKSYMPECSIGADVITGFPGETEEEFETAYKFIESLPLTYLHVFSYSDRKGTAAFDMPGKITEGVKRERTQRLRSLSTEKRNGYLGNYVGRKVTVVFDNTKLDGCLKGVSENYINVLVAAEPAKWRHVRLTGIVGESMKGE